MRYDFRSFGNPYRYPFGEVSSAVRQSGATVWIGAGFDGGLRAGAWEKAQTFGFSGIFTTKLAWDSFLEEQDTQGALT